MKSLSFLSHASPTGRKQGYAFARPTKVPCGQEVELVIVRMSVAAVLESGGEVGEPESKEMRDSL
jgi:hypothetical protein